MRAAFSFSFVVLFVLADCTADASNHVACPPTVHRSLPLRVVDGDTFRLRGERIRILGIDTPERDQPGSAQAASRLLALLRSGPLVIVRHGRDIYCRTLADVYVNGWNVAAVMKAEGYAKPLPSGRRGWHPDSTTPPNFRRGISIPWRGHVTLQHGSRQSAAAARTRRRLRVAGFGQVPTMSEVPSRRRSAIVERYESLPVLGFSDGTFSSSTESRPNSPSMVTRCWLRPSPGTA